MNAQPSNEYLNSVSDLMVATRRYLDGLKLVPRTDCADSILLGLLSKSIVLTEAIIALSSKGFSDEAFSLCRSCLEVQLTIRYLTNTDTVRRCQRYLNYFAKDKSYWLQITPKYYPNMPVRSNVDLAELEAVAATYPDRNRWSEHTLKDMASEQDNFATRDDGRPLDDLFYYEILYKLMSHYVHVTEPSLDPQHLTAPGEEFRVHPGAGVPKYGSDALRVSFLSVHLNLTRILRYFNMTYPDDLKVKYDAVVETHVQCRATGQQNKP